VEPDLARHPPTPLSGYKIGVSWQADVMRAFLITGNPGSGKSTLAAELSRRGHVAIDADDLASWEDSSGVPVEPPSQVDEAWQLAHRWVWNRAHLEAALAASGDTDRLRFVCGIALNQDQMLDLFERVFVLVIEADAQDTRLARARSPQRTEGVKQQIRQGRPVFRPGRWPPGRYPWTQPRRRRLSRTPCWPWSTLIAQISSSRMCHVRAEIDPSCMS
jgi:hypothetical protein